VERKLWNSFKELKLRSDIREYTIDTSLGAVEARMLAEALRRRGIKVELVEGGEIRAFSIDKVLYFLLKAFYENDEEALAMADPYRSKNPAYVLLPYEVAVYAKLRGLEPPPEPFEGALWRVALEVSLRQPSEAYSALKVIPKLRELFPISR